MSIEKRLERVEAILDARGLDWDHPRVEDDHFVGAGKMVADEPAKEPVPAKPPKPEYREPVLPADVGKMCEFSNDGEFWDGFKLGGFVNHTDLKWRALIATRLVYGYEYCRIKNDA